MKDSFLPIDFPIGGLVTNTSLASQPKGTTPSAINVRGYDPRAGRFRGGQREGQTKYCPAQISGANLIQNISKCVSSQELNAVVTTVAVNGAALFTLATTLGTTATFGPGASAGNCWGAGNIVYFASAEVPSKIYAYRVQMTALGVMTVTLLWTSAATLMTGANKIGMCFGGGFLWVAGTDAGNPDAEGRTIYLYKLDPNDGTFLGGTYVYAAVGRVLSNQQNLGNFVAYASGTVAISFSYVNAPGGGPSLHLFGIITGSVTEHLIAASSTNCLDLTSDGAAFYCFTGFKIVKMSVAGSPVWTFTPPGTEVAVWGGYDPVRATVVFEQGTATPLLRSITGATGAASLSASTPTFIHMVRTSTATHIGSLTTGATPDIRFCTINPDTLVPASTAFVTITLLATSKVQNFSVAAAAVFSGSTRTRGIRGLAVSQGHVRRFTSSGVTAITNGTSVLDSAAKQIFSVQLNQNLYFVDGSAVKYYDSGSDSMVTLAATVGLLPLDSAGNSAQLVTAWRNRLVLSGFPYDPYNWFMSAVDDPTDWDYAPSPSLETQAVAGNNSSAGLNPDIITCLIPYSDELLIHGGDHTIYQMTGDPASGGRIDMVTDAIGIAFGQPWCRDGQGNLYFMSSLGAIYKFVPGGVPEMISESISELLYEILVSSSSIRMAWNERLGGFHVLITPLAGASATFHYFYDVRNQSWWRDQRPNNLNPIAVCQFDGDTPADRCILMGSWNGYIHKIDVDALDDDGTGIASYVFLGPVQDRDGNGLTMADLQCQLDSGSSDVLWTAHAGADVQSALASSAKASGRFDAGRNRSQAIRMFGHAMFIKLASEGLAASSWAMELLRARIRMPQGKGRQRKF